MDALAISKNSNEGAGAVLSKGEFQDFSRDVLKIRAAEAEKQNANKAAIGKLVQQDVSAKWASDNINYFQPKMQEIKDYTIELFKKNNGKLSEMDVFDVQSKWGKLKAEADASNSLYAEELNRMKSIEDDPQGLKWDAGQSNMARNIFNNPWQNEATKKEIDAAGGIVKWRVANQSKYGNVAAYDLNKDIQEGFKDKVSTWYDRDKNGNLKLVDRGDFLEGRGYKGIDPKKIGTHFNDFWNRTDYKGDKFRKQSRQWVDQNLEITPEGMLIPKSEAAKEITKKITTTKGYTPEQIKEGVARLYGQKAVEARFQSEDIIFTQGKKSNTNINLGSGDGGSGLGPVSVGSMNITRGYDPNTTGVFIDNRAMPAITGKQFSTTPIKVNAAFGPDQIDLETGVPIPTVGDVESTYGQMMVMPRLTQDATISQNGKKVNLKAGHFLTNEQLKLAEASLKTKQIIKYDVYANGRYEKFNPSTQIKEEKSVTTPANIIFGSGMLSVSDKEKALYMKNYNDLVEDAKEKNKQNGFFQDPNATR